MMATMFYDQIKPFCPEAELMMSDTDSFLLRCGFTL